MPDRVYLNSIDPELVPGARNAIDVCLQLKQGERVTIITDEATRAIAAALQSEVERVGSEYNLFVLEHHARRPLKYMPEIILDDLAIDVHHVPVPYPVMIYDTRHFGARTELARLRLRGKDGDLRPR